jgi:hypothetical protein
MCSFLRTCSSCPPLEGVQGEEIKGPSAFPLFKIRGGGGSYETAIRNPSQPPLILRGGISLQPPPKNRRK